MQGQKKEEWLKLCEQAAVEQDPKKLIELIRQIDALLQEKRDRLNRRAPRTSNEGNRQ